MAFELVEDTIVEKDRRNSEECKLSWKCNSGLNMYTELL